MPGKEQLETRRHRLRLWRPCTASFGEESERTGGSGDLENKLDPRFFVQSAGDWGSSISYFVRDVTYVSGQEAETFL